MGSFYSKGQTDLPANDSLYYDIDASPYLKKYYHNGIAVSQSWIKKGRYFPIVLSPDNEAYVFNNDRNLWHDFLGKNFRLPQKDVEGKLLVALYIDKAGKVSDKRVLRAIPGCRECNNEALKLIQKLPHFSPAIYNGRKVCSVKYLFIPFGEE